MNYVTTAVDIFKNNQKVGWWTDKETGESLVGKRSLGMVNALIHSELSEGMEGLRKDLNDDHLPHRKMVEVEIADAAIRAYDFLGSELDSGNLTLNEDLVKYAEDAVYVFTEKHGTETPVDYISALHTLVSIGYSQTRNYTEQVDQNESYAGSCLSLILGCEQMSEKFNYDLHGAIEEKVTYNQNRADHKLENRNKEGGKAF